MTVFYKFQIKIYYDEIFFYSYALKVEATQLKRLLKGGYKIITYSCLQDSFSPQKDSFTFSYYY